jgi:hypothetical protein
VKKSVLMLIAIAAFLLPVGCASVPAWWRVDGPYEKDTYAVTLPRGWMMPSRVPFLLLTKDGVFLQNITISRSNIAASLENTKKKFSAGMLPQEAAEVFLDDAAANEDIANFEILENRPVTIGGMAAFRAVYTYKDKDKLRYKEVTYGFVREKTFYDMSYTAPARYYFDKDLKIFENFVKSFRITAPEREVDLPPVKHDEEKSILQGGSL